MEAHVHILYSNSIYSFFNLLFIWLTLLVIYHSLTSNFSLFIDETKITDAVRNHLTYTEEDNSETVVFVPYYEFYTCLSAMVADCSKIWVCLSTALANLLA